MQFSDEVPQLAIDHLESMRSSEALDLLVDRHLLGRPKMSRRFALLLCPEVTAASYFVEVAGGMGLGPPKPPSAGVEPRSSGKTSITYSKDRLITITKLTKVQSNLSQKQENC